MSVEDDTPSKLRALLRDQIDNSDRADKRHASELEAVAAENRRLTAWLKHISTRTKGMAGDLTAQALYSDQWPPTKRGKK